MNKLNAYHVRLRLSPQKEGYKPRYLKGIVFAKNAQIASAVAAQKIEYQVNEANKFMVKIEVKSVDKLRDDFTFTTKIQEDVKPPKT